MSDAVTTLRDRLAHATGPTELLDAAWEAFTLAAACARALTWEPGVDAIAALAGAAAAGRGRDLLPLPQGAQVPPPDTMGVPFADALAQALVELQQHLNSCARSAGDPEQVLLLFAAADEAEETAQYLADLRAAA
jgi:hypothetical protein